MSLVISDEEFEELKTKADGGDLDVDADRFIKNGEPSSWGDSYIPGAWLEETEDV